VTTVKRMFWLALGVTVGALVVRKLSRTAEQLTPRGLSQSLQGVADAVRDFVDEVREGAAVRESELSEGSGLDGRLGAKPEDFR
jgi:F0F1-type ATP synthase membrane subunit a